MKRTRQEDVVFAFFVDACIKGKAVFVNCGFNKTFT